MEPEPVLESCSHQRISISAHPSRAAREPQQLFPALPTTTGCRGCALQGNTDGKERQCLDAVLVTSKCDILNY